MSTRTPPTDRQAPVFDEIEWQAQERARIEARDGAAAPRHEASAARYHAISQALRQPPMAAIPLGFATRVARRAAAARQLADERVERMLLQGLGVLLGLSAAGVTVLYGAQWLHSADDLVPAGAGPWMLLLVACGALHAMLEHWLRRRASH